MIGSLSIEDSCCVFDVQTNGTLYHIAPRWEFQNPIADAWETITTDGVFVDASVFQQFVDEMGFDKAVKAAYLHTINSIYLGASTNA